MASRVAAAEALASIALAKATIRDISHAITELSSGDEQLVRYTAAIATKQLNIAKAATVIHETELKLNEFISHVEAAVAQRKMHRAELSALEGKVSKLESVRRQVAPPDHVPQCETISDHLSAAMGWFQHAVLPGGDLHGRDCPGDIARLQDMVKDLGVIGSKCRSGKPLTEVVLPAAPAVKVIAKCGLAPCKPVLCQTIASDDEADTEDSQPSSPSPSALVGPDGYDLTAMGLDADNEVRNRMTDYSFASAQASEIREPAHSGEPAFSAGADSRAPQRSGRGGARCVSCEKPCCGPPCVRRSCDARLRRRQ